MEVETRRNEESFYTSLVGREHFKMLLHLTATKKRGWQNFAVANLEYDGFAMAIAKCRL